MVLCSCCESEHPRILQDGNENGFGIIDILIPRVKMTERRHLYILSGSPWVFPGSSVVTRGLLQYLRRHSPTPLRDSSLFCCRPRCDWDCTKLVC